MSLANSILFAACFMCAIICLPIYLSWQDWRHQTIPLWGLTTWVILCICWANVHKSVSFDAFYLLSGFSLCTLLYQYIRQKEYIGFADLVILVSLSTWLHLTQLPALFISCGALGVLSVILSKKKRFPFVPIVFLAALIVYFLKA